MPPPIRLLAIGAFALAAAFAGQASAQNDAKPKPAPTAAPAEKSADGGVSRYCANVGPLAAEARMAMQQKRLAELDEQIKQRIADLDKKEAEARDWVTKRETLMKAASDDVVAIFGKMQIEAAAAQLAAMDAPMAAAILGKLSPRAASAILGEMDAVTAGKLTSLLSGAAAEQKS
jgi:flagellar motility protein MotE (MotC chaperone)